MAGRYLVLIALAGVLIWWSWSSRPIQHAPGVLVHVAPDQQPITEPPLLLREGFKIQALAKFDLRARVLSTERYYMGRAARLSPEDLALGWGRMSDTAIIDQLTITQSSRFYFYAWPRNPPIPVGEIISSSANMHIIPANDTVASALKAVRVGHIVDVKGYLVRVETPDGWRWVSSTTRSDSGDGACEVVWAESLASSE